MLGAVLAPVLALALMPALHNPQARWMTLGLGVLLLGMVLRVAVRTADQSQQALRRQAHHDQLTGLPNRHHLDGPLTLELQRQLDRELAPALACCYVDVDNLKEINDRLGHQAGDRMIQAVGTSLRELDGFPGHAVIRMGGDEFLVIAPVAPALQEVQAQHLAHELQGMLHALAAIESAREVRASMGCSWLTLSRQHGSAMEQLDRQISQADLAQVSAKGDGGDRIRVRAFTEQLGATARRHTSVARHLPQAWDRQQMCLVYQPIVNLLDGSVYGAEALLRWHHPELGNVGPLEAIQAAERRGLVETLGIRILDTAMQAMASQPGQHGFRVGINLSAQQLHPSAIGRLLQCLTDSGQQQHVWLEITEQALIEDHQFAAGALEELRANGVIVAIDDFGTSYCGLDYLCTLPVDIVKLDGSIAREALHSATRRRVAQLGVKLAESIGAVALAEGV